MATLVLDDMLSRSRRIETREEFEQLAQLKLRMSAPRDFAEAARIDTLLQRHGIGRAPLTSRGFWYRDLPPGKVDVLQVFGESRA